MKSHTSPDLATKRRKRDLVIMHLLSRSRNAIDYLFTLSQLDDFFLDALGNLTILALQLAQLQEFA